MNTISIRSWEIFIKLKYKNKLKINVMEQKMRCVFVSVVVMLPFFLLLHILYTPNPNENFKWNDKQ